MPNSFYPQKTNGDVVLEISDLKTGYRGRFFLDRVNLPVKRGIFLGVLGPNGSGKSTLLKAISGTLPIMGGSIKLFGRPLDSYTGKERATLVAVLPQDTTIQFPFTCGDIVWMGRYPHKKRFSPVTPEDVEIVEWAMRIIGVKNLEHRLITDVSGGERQRVLLARVLAQKTPLILLDEPVSAMDIRWTLETLRFLSTLCHRDNVTVVAVMHDINMAAMFCDEIVFLKNGKMIAYGSTEEVVSAEILKEVYETDVVVFKPDWLCRPQVIFPPESDCHNFRLGSKSSKYS